MMYLAIIKARYIMKLFASIDEILLEHKYIFMMFVIDMWLEI